jgi:hypothetical protein
LIYSDFAGEAYLGLPIGLAASEQLLTDMLRSWSWVISEEVEDLGPSPQAGELSLSGPAPERRVLHQEQLGGGLLCDVEVEDSLAKMVG